LDDFSFLCFCLLFAVVLAADPIVCSWCKTLVSQIEQLQAKKGRSYVESYINELCEIATDEAKTVCDDWTAYGMDKIIDAIMANENSDKVFADCGSC